jgi:hypothetical protein
MSQCNGLNIFIAGGVTSNLFSALLPSFIKAEHVISATVREATNPERVKVLSGYGVKFISKEESLKKMFNAVLWMSTHEDVEYLTLLSRNTPTLIISSTAIMDYHLGKESEEQLNAYKRSKLALSRVPGVTTLIPGFYIEDVATPDWASRGLLGDTTDKLFAAQADATFDWNKADSVTPKSFMISMINRWLDVPKRFFQNEPIIVCSDTVYRRWELRAFGHLKNIPNSQLLSPIEGEIYYKFCHPTSDYAIPITVSHDMVRMACVVAALLKRE